MTRDIAIKFNQTYGETFVVPEAVIRREVATVPGLDGQKMSKSYGNTLEIFADEKALRKKVMSIVMDSRTPAEPKPDAERNLCIQLLHLVAPSDVAADLEGRLRAGRPRLRGPEEGALRALLELLRPARAAPGRAPRGPRVRRPGPGGGRRARPLGGIGRDQARAPGGRP
jgi:tryptophanyl-tRNA synthetase